MPGILAPGPGVVAAPAQPCAAVQAAPIFCWVAIEASGGRRKGEVICTEPSPLPVGHFLIGDRAVIPDLAGGPQGCFAKRVPQTEIPAMQLDDLRILPIKFDGQNIRRREFNNAVAEMVDGVPQGGGLQLEGPTACLNIVKNLRDQNMTPTSYHEFWLRSSEIPKGNRSIFEHECLSRILESLITVDQLNICALQGVELLVRRMQVIREAHRVSPSNPDYTSADHFMGWKFKKASQGIDSSLAAHVASELKTEAAILKEARKAREEENNRRRGAGKNSQQSGAEQK